MLQQNQSTLRDELMKSVTPDEVLCEQIISMGFDIELIRQALKDTSNDMQKAIENLLKLQANGSYHDALKEVIQNATQLQDSVIQPSTSGSSSASACVSKALKTLEERAEEMEV